MKLFALRLLTILLLFCAWQESDAQINRKSIRKSNRRMANFKGQKEWFPKAKQYQAISFSLNALNYYGDLAPKPNAISTDISFTRPALGVSLMHRFGPRYTLAAEFMYGTLKGSDAESADFSDAENGKFRYQRNLSFRNRIKELSVLAYFDLFENDQTYINRVAWTPYVFAGFTGFVHNPQAQAPATGLNGQPLPEAGQWVDLQPLGTEGQYATLDPTDMNYGIKPYSKLQMAIPFGVGARLRLDDLFDLWFDIGFRYTFTDYLDDVSQHYVDLGVFQGNELAKAMSYRGNELPADKKPLSNTYTGRDGVNYTVISGYGQEFRDNMRGSKKDRDIYMVTSIKLTYILGKNFQRAKFR